MRRLRKIFGVAVLGALLWSVHPLSRAQSRGGDGRSAAAFPSFKEVAETIGITFKNVSGGIPKDYIVESLGNGAAFIDYDNDDDIDLLIVNGSTLDDYARAAHPMAALYRNIGGRFRDVTGISGMRARGWGVGACVADYDNDGYPDVYLTAFGPNVLYRNTGEGRFEDLTAQAGVGDPRWGTNCAFADYDRDGDVDLYVANYVRFDEAATPRRGESDRCRYMDLPVFCGPLDLPGAPDTLYRNNGDGTFSDVTMTAGIEDPGYFGLGVAFRDFDGDGWPDIYVANDAVPNFLFRNDRDGTFSDVSFISGTALSEDGAVQSGMGVTAGDYDGDGDPDIFVTNFARDTNTLYRNTGDLFFVDVTERSGLGEISRRYLGWGTGFADLDNDGLEDIFVVNGHVYPEVDRAEIGQEYAQPKEVYRNAGDGTFVEIATVPGGDLLEHKPGRGAAFGDYDNDGDIDVIVVNLDEAPSFYRNDGGNERHWISFRLEGTESNRAAVGARVEIEAGGRTRVAEVQSGGSYLSQNDMRVHFGLGDLTRVDRVRFIWPSGRTDVLVDLEADRFLTVREGEGLVATIGP